MTDSHSILITSLVLVTSVIAFLIYKARKMLYKMNADNQPNTVNLWEDAAIPYYKDESVMINYNELVKPIIGNVLGSIAGWFLRKNPNLKPKLRLFDLKEGKNNPAIIIFPGGAYMARALHIEGEPIAEWLNSIGISAFIADYRVMPYKHPAQITDAKRAIRYVRYHAKKYNINPDKIGIMGFSAGGHLASTLGTHFDEGIANAQDPIDKTSSKPNIMVLSYPVITMKEHTHKVSKNVLLGANPSEEMIELLSTETQVSNTTPPTFIWHTKTDNEVPVENTYLFAKALKKHNVPHELHIFPKGKHGLGLAKKHKTVKDWTNRCEKWLKSVEFIN